MKSATMPDAITAGPSADRGLTWRRLLLIAGTLATVAIGAVSAVLGDLEGGTVMLGLALVTWLTRVRRGSVGAIGVALAGAITFYFMLTAATTNIRAGSAMSSVLVSSVLAAVSLLALIAAIGFLANRSGSTTGPRLGVGASVLLLGGLVVWGASISRVDAGVGDIVLVSQNMTFSENELRVDPGELVVTMENEDLFWHTFTIAELGVDLRVPLGAELGASFDAPPGEYQFVCAIPGHAEAGMVGTLTVES